jgi:hypothetical protein
MMTLKLSMSTLVWSIERSVFNPSQCHSIVLPKLGCRLHCQKRILLDKSTYKHSVLAARGTVAWFLYPRTPKIEWSGRKRRSM